MIKHGVDERGLQLPLYAFFVEVEVSPINTVFRLRLQEQSNKHLCTFGAMLFCCVDLLLQDGFVNFRIVRKAWSDEHFPIFSVTQAS